MTELSTISDFPFTKSDFIEEFKVYQDQFDLYWFDDINNLSIFKQNLVEILLEDVHVLGIRYGGNEFYIGTLYGEWCLHSNMNLRWPFKEALNNSNHDLYKWIKKEYAIPDEIIYSIIRISKKYKVNNSYIRSNFSSWTHENTNRLILPLCENCHKPVRTENYIPVNNFSRGICYPPWNSGWKGQCEHCNYDYNISLRQIVSNGSWPIERRTLIKSNTKKYMDSMDSFVILSGVEVSVSEISGFEKSVSTKELFISTNELKYILQKLKASPLLEQYDWDADCT